VARDSFERLRQKGLMLAPLVGSAKQLSCSLVRVLPEQSFQGGGLLPSEFGAQESELHGINGAVLDLLVGSREHGFEAGVAVNKPGFLRSLYFRSGFGLLRGFGQQGSIATVQFGVCAFAFLIDVGVHGGLRLGVLTASDVDRETRFREQVSVPGATESGRFCHGRRKIS
jgi:hypothetical protein